MGNFIFPLFNLKIFQISRAKSQRKLKIIKTFLFRSENFPNFKNKILEQVENFGNFFLLLHQFSKFQKQNLSASWKLQKLFLFLFKKIFKFYKQEARKVKHFQSSSLFTAKKFFKFWEGEVRRLDNFKNSLIFKLQNFSTFENLKESCKF